VQGVQAHPQKFRYVTNPGKNSEKTGKITENLAKNGAQCCLYFTNWRPAFDEKHVKTFFGGHT